MFRSNSNSTSRESILSLGLDQLHSQNWHDSLASSSAIPSDLPSSETNKEFFMSAVKAHSEQEYLPYIPPEVLIDMGANSPFLSNALCAYYAITLDKKDISHVYYQKANMSMVNALSKNADENVLALVYMFLFCQRTNLGKEATTFRKLAITMAFHLNLNNPVTNISLKDFSVKCNIFWNVFVIDYFSAVVKGAPTVLSTKRLSLPLPFSRKDIIGHSRNFKAEIDVMRSESNFIPIPPNLSRIASFIVLIKIYSRIMEYHNADYEGYQSELDHACLAASLRHWEMKTGNVLAKEQFSIQSMFSFYLYMIHQAAVISLSTARSNKLKLSDVSGFICSPKFGLAIQAASKITEIIQIFTENTNSRLFFYISQALLSSSIIHEILIRYHPDPLIVQKSLEEFQMNLDTARMMSNLGISYQLHYEKILKRQSRLPTDLPFKPIDTFESLFSFFYPTT